MPFYDDAWLCDFVMKTMPLLDRKRALAIKPILTREELTRLDTLNQQLAEFDFGVMVHDPLYYRLKEALGLVIRKKEATNMATATEHLLKANKDLLDALLFLKELPVTFDERAMVEGAILHSLDDLALLAEQLEVTGFQHPDDL